MKVNVDMTEYEMQLRMEEIDNERIKLREEKAEYERYFYNKRLKEELDNHKKYEGKCFLTKNLSDNQQKQIKAFKVLKVLEDSNRKYAQCICLVDGYELNCWSVKGIKNQAIGLWMVNTLRMMNNPGDPKVIDFYEEISQEEFETMYREYQNDLNDKVYS